MTMSASSASRRASATWQREISGQRTPRQLSRVEVTCGHTGWESDRPRTSARSPRCVVSAQRWMRASIERAARPVAAESTSGQLLALGGARQAVAAQVVAATLEQRDPRRPPERGAHQRQVLREQLVLQRARAGGDQHARPGEQRRHEVGEGLAGAGARLDDQRLAPGERGSDALRHAQLLATHPEVRQRPLEGPALTEYVFKIQHEEQRPRLRHRRILAPRCRACRGPYLPEFAAN